MIHSANEQQIRPLSENVLNTSRINYDAVPHNSTRLSNASKAATVLCVLAGLLCLGFGASSVNLFFTSVGLFCFAIMLLPIAVNRRYDLLSCWSMALLSVTLGCLLRGFYIGLNYPDHQTLDFLYFLGSPLEEFYGPAIYLSLFLLFCTIGYGVAPVKSKLKTENGNLQIDKRRIYIFAFLALAIALVSSILYVQLTGGFDWQNLSSKRTAITSLEISASHRTYGFLRLFASIAILAHLVVLADAIRSSYKKKRKYSLAVILFLSAVFIPIYGSTRSDVFVYTILSMAVLYFCSKRIPWVRVLASLVAAIFIFQTMSVLRSAKNLSFIDVLTAQTINVSILDRLILNRNSLELGKTAHVINAVPEQLDYRYGATIGVWALAIIPRGIWNSKPLISSGPVIGTTVYGNRTSGVPPGVAAELYWNFHLIGIVIGGLFIGGLFKWIDKRFKPSSSSPISTLAIYLYGPFTIGYLIFGAGIGFGIFGALIKTIVAMTAFKFMRIR